MCLIKEERCSSGELLIFNRPVNVVELGRELGNRVIVHCFLLGQKPDMVYLPHRRNFVDHDFLEAPCLASFLQHVSSLAMEALPSNSPLHMLPIQRHNFNFKRTVRIHVNMCRCSIKNILSNKAIH